MKTSSILHALMLAGALVIPAASMRAQDDNVPPPADPEPGADPDQPSITNLHVITRDLNEAEPAPVTPQYDARADVTPTPLPDPARSSNRNPDPNSYYGSVNTEGTSDSNLPRGRIAPPTDYGTGNRVTAHPIQEGSARTNPNLVSPDRQNSTELRDPTSNDAARQAVPAETPR